MGYIPPEDQWQRQFDVIDDAVNVILAEHRMVHKGRFFSIFVKTDIDADASYYIGIQVGTKIPHLKQAWCSTDAEKVTVELIEGATFTDGTAVPVFNRNRNSSETPEVTVVKGVSSVSGGVVIDSDYLGGGASEGPFAMALGSEVAGVTEWNLKPNENYVLKLLKKGAASATALVKLIWYEV